MFIRAYITAALHVVHEYDGSEPLPAFLKKYFAQHKKFGSRDRRQIAHLCFCYYRLGKAVLQVESTERMLAGLFLCSTNPQPVLEELRPEWNARIAAPLEEKISFIQQKLPFSVAEIFPFAQRSPSVDTTALAVSHLIQPDTYLRIRPEKEKAVWEKLQAAGIPYTEAGPQCIAVAPATKLEDVLFLDAEAVVQDRSSQQVLSLLQTERNAAERFSAWDCCAASGGKSLLLKDLYPRVQLTVSDVRASILANLRKRFQKAQIGRYNWFVADLSAPHFHMNEQFDVVLCDAPCSGSGTWSRSPEQLYFFRKEKIAHYTGLQRRITLAAQKQLKENGFFVYITCSVFAEENEQVVELLQKETKLKLRAMQYFEGCRQKADTLFAALLVKEPS